mgnify:CR=1 FL=1
MANLVDFRKAGEHNGHLDKTNGKVYGYSDNTRGTACSEAEREAFRMGYLDGWYFHKDGIRNEVFQKEDV